MTPDPSARRCVVCGTELPYTGTGRPRTYCQKHAEASHREAKYRSWVKESATVTREVFVRDEDRGAYLEAMLALTDALNNLEAGVRKKRGEALSTEKRRELFDAAWDAVVRLDDATGTSLTHPDGWSRRLGRRSDYVRGDYW